MDSKFKLKYKCKFSQQLDKKIAYRFKVLSILLINYWSINYAKTQICKTQKVSIVNLRILILTDLLLICYRIPTTYLRETTEYTKTENDPKINKIKWIVYLLTVVVHLVIGVTICILIISRRRRSKSCTKYLLLLKTHKLI